MTHEGVLHDLKQLIKFMIESVPRSTDPGTTTIDYLPHINRRVHSSELNSQSRMNK